MVNPDGISDGLWFCRSNRMWAGESFNTLKRTTYILNKWFSLIQNAAHDWWEKGAEPGGGLAMNDGVSTCLAVLRSAFEHRIERALQQVVLEELRREFGPEDSGWWLAGVPKVVRLEVTKRFEEDDGKRGSKEHYFDLIHYRKIAMENWDLFQDILSFGKKGSGRITGLPG